MHWSTMKINWEEFKIYKKEMAHLKGDNFAKLVYFVRSFYNLKSALRIYELLSGDETSKMMLEKRSIDSAAKLEKYMNEL